MRESTVKKKNERHAAPARRVQYASVSVWSEPASQPLRDMTRAFRLGLRNARANALQEAVATVINGVEQTSDDLDIREA